MSLTTSLDSATAGVLAEFHFSEIPFERLRAELEGRGLEQMSGRLTVMPDPLHNSETESLPLAKSSEYSRLWRLGMDAIEAGQVASVVLNGGMSTRFGGVPKGTIQVSQNKSLLYWKLKQIQNSSRGRVPILLMDSFATSKSTQRHLSALDGLSSVASFDQFVSLRLTEDAKLYRDETGMPSLYTPGHGDLPFALKRCGRLRQLMAKGVKWLAVSNVDNLGATLDPLIIGQHVAHNQPMTVELVSKIDGDVGGYAARVDGKPTLVESFRSPAGFDSGGIHLFNTNNFIFDTEFVARDIDLDWFAVTKTLNGDRMVQFERLVGQLADFCEVHWLLVDRDGPRNRFMPIKNSRDLETRLPQLTALLEDF